ncbi:MAG: DNA primase [Candidatus Omnitrophota bacterium]
MPIFIPENILEDILDRIDIVELISGYLPLKRSGRNFKANCPFHHEKTASFMVSADKQIYHCFGCGESGNAFKFLMRYERMEFPEAVEVLAKKAGVILPAGKKEMPHSLSLTTQLYKVNEEALYFYENNLASKSSLAAKNYLLKRGVKEESIKLFKLGLALDKWDSLINYTRAKNISLGLLEKAGLILPKENGGYYDRFRNRIIFPIFDVKSRAIGFGARVLDSSLPKYVNSPETPIYIKGKNLYGLNFAKEAIRQNDSLIIVEGYLDFIMPFQEGMRNIVASSGTALTEDQVRLIKRHTSNIIMVYDGDSAGQMAAMRALDIFIQESVNVRVVSLPAGFDPDSFVRKNGIGAFKEKINNAENLFDYKIKVLKSQYNVKEIEGRSKIAAEMLLTVNKLNNAVLKSEYVRKTAEELNIKEEALLQELNNKANNVFRTRVYAPAQAAVKKIEINPIEKLIIKLMLEEVSLVDYVRQRLCTEDFNSDISHRIVSAVFDLFDQGKNIDRGILLKYLGDETVSQIICEPVVLTVNPEYSKERIIDDCIKRLKDEKIKLRKQDLHDEIKLAQRTGDNQRLNSLMHEFNLLMKKG